MLAAAAVAVVALVTGGSWALLQTHSGSPRVAGAVSPAPTGTGASPSAGGAAPASDTLLAWTPGQLPPGIGERVAHLPGVDRVLTVVGGNVWLTRSTAASGAVVNRPSGGFAIPLELGAAELGVLRSFLPAADLSLLPALARGEAVLGATSARLRRLGAGGDLQLGSHHLRVAGVVPDADIGAHELFVSVETARALGITIPRYLLIDPAPGAPRDRIFAGIGALLPSGTPLRTRGPGETPFLRQGDAVLSPVMEKAAAGEFAARPLPNGFAETFRSIAVPHEWCEMVLVGSCPMKRGTKHPP